MSKLPGLVAVMHVSAVQSHFGAYGNEFLKYLLRRTHGQRYLSQLVKIARVLRN